MIGSFGDNDHISVCICTFRRLPYLERLLEKLAVQRTYRRFTYSIVVVDNDAARSAESVVRKFAAQWEGQVEYHVEPEQNIALARNMAVSRAMGTHIAFIDDDEFPDFDWLSNLLETAIQYKADGVLGPVLPHFETTPPSWLVISKILERMSFPTGTILTNTNQTRTGNVLLKKECFQPGERNFNPAFGRTGGEDTDFFGRAMKRGLRFMWCQTAPVHETIPPERMKRSYHLKRALLRGSVIGRKTRLLSPSTVKSLLAVTSYTPVILTTGIISQGLFMKYLVRCCDHVGKLLAVMGIHPIRERSE